MIGIIKTKILIAIPAFNTVEPLERLIRELLYLSEDLIVINDGSTDKTKEMLEDIKVYNISHNSNLGLAQAIRTAEKYAVKKKYEAILFLDSDGQHPAKYVPFFLKKLDDHNMVLGDRFSNLSLIPQTKICSNLLASLLIFEHTGKFIRDVACGFRGYMISNHLFQHGQCLKGFSLIYYRLIQLIIKNKKIHRIPIPPIYDHNLPLCTKPQEIIGICEALLYKYPDSISAKKILHATFFKKSLKINIANTGFELKFDGEINQYIISTSDDSALSLYR